MSPTRPARVEDLKRFGYDYWALGHVHAAEEVSRDPWIVYPGNIQGRSVRETGAKGAMRVTVADGRVVEARRVTLDAARWARASVDVSDCEDEAEALARIEARLRDEHAARRRPPARRASLARRSDALACAPRRAARGDRGGRPRHRLSRRRRSLGRADQDRDARAAARAPNASFETDALDVEALVREAAEDPEFAQRARPNSRRKSPTSCRANCATQCRTARDDLKLLADEARDRLYGEIADDAERRMRFESLVLERYGAFTDRALELREGAHLHVVLGANEAGKTSALNAIGDLLFGFGKTTNYDFLHDKTTLRVGARLRLADGSRSSCAAARAAKTRCSTRTTSRSPMICWRACSARSRARFSSGIRPDGGGACATAGANCYAPADGSPKRSRPLRRGCRCWRDCARASTRKPTICSARAAPPARSFTRRSTSIRTPKGICARPSSPPTR